MDKETKQEFKKVSDQFKNIIDQFKIINNQFKTVNNQFKTVNNQFKEVKREFRDEFKNVYQRFELADQKFDQMFKMIISLKEEHKEFAKKSDLIAFKDEIISHIDGFVKKFEKQDTEIISLKSGYNRHDKQITKLAKHSNLSL